LGVTLLLAGSPQAKGESRNGGELSKIGWSMKLRLANAKTLNHVQAVLDCYLPSPKRKFSKPAAKAQATWRKANSQQIEQALVFQTTAYGS